MNKAATTRPWLQAVLIATLTPPLLTAALTVDASGIWAYFAWLNAVQVLVFGFPLYGLLRWRGWFNAYTAVTGGALLGVVPIGVLALLRRRVVAEPVAPARAVDGMFCGTQVSHSLVSNADVLAYFAMFGALGALSGWLFWYCMRRLSLRTEGSGA